MKAQKLPIWATILTLCAITILCALGTWQLQRLEWKTTLLKTIEAEYAKDAENIIITQNQLDKSLNMTRGSITGTFHHEKQITISPRTYNGKPGYHILTPLKIKPKHFILVNRGWIPLGMKNHKTKNRKKIKVTGLFRTPESPNIFVPKNNPKKGAWHRIDVQQIKYELKLDNIAPVILYAESNKEGFPIAAATKPNPNNNHMQYALFWFAMAASLLVIYTLRFIKNVKEDQRPKSI